ncbi:GSU2403 family nucleotidyltransferase fold protein [Azospirillum palustre]
MLIAPFTDEQLRTIINLEQHYAVWSEADHALSLLPYGFKWKSAKAREYLYEMQDRKGNGKSLGLRSEETERLYCSYRAKKEELIERRNRSSMTLDQTCRIYRALRLPLLSAEAAKLLRKADQQRLLGTHLMVVGADAMIAYALEMRGWIGSPFDRTGTLDLAVLGKAPNSRSTPVWSLLKAVDRTYTVNPKASFQARNAKGYTVELAAAPSQAAVQADKPIPVRKQEQGWLLLGKRVSRVAVARDGSPARVVAPDPRWYALHSLWLADHGEGVSEDVRFKHRRRGEALLAGIPRLLPTHSLSDPGFLEMMPPDLRPLYDRYTSAHQDASLPDW